MFVYMQTFQVPSTLERGAKIVFIQTTGKTLEEIDLIFAKDSIKNSDLAREIVAHHNLDDKPTVTMEERV
jgi:hypothetical protein